MAKQLNDLFYSTTKANNPVFLSSSAQQIKKSLPHIPLKRIQRFLDEQIPYGVHKPLRKNFKRNHYYVSQINELFEIDLVDLSSLSSQNDGYKFLLTIVDTFSKRAWVKMLKNKSGAEITKKFREITDGEGIRPMTVRSDRGKEFNNSTFLTFLKNRNIKHQFPSTTSAFKCSIVEIFNKTLKNKMNRYFTFARTKRYVNILDKLVQSYNHSFHSTIQMRPADVQVKHTPLIYANTHRKHVKEKPTGILFNIGDHVRVVRKTKSAFKRGYTPNFSREIFNVVKIINKIPHALYVIADAEGRIIDGKLYSWELARVEIPSENAKRIIGQNSVFDQKNKKFHVKMVNGLDKWVTKDELKPENNYTAYYDMYNTLFKNKK